MTGSALRTTSWTPSYLTRAGADWLVANGAALVGIDAANIDDMTDGTRPAHTLLLDAGIPIVEHLTGLAEVPPSGASSPPYRRRSRGSGRSRCGPSRAVPSA